MIPTERNDLHPASRLWVLLCLAFLTLLPGPVAHGDDSVLVIGAVHADSATARQRLAPMASYVAAQLADVGIEQVLIVVAPDTASLIDLLRYERVDWVAETAFNALTIEETGLAEMVARTWRRGTPSYRSLFVVRRDSAIDDLRDLNGAAVAFERELSTSAFFVPAVELLENEHTLCRLGGPRQAVASHCVGFAFSNRPYNTAMWVHKGVAQAGVLSSDDWASTEAVPTTLRDDLRVLLASDDVPRGIELLRIGLDPAVRERLLDVMLTMHTNSDADAALNAYFQTRRIDLLDQKDQERLDVLRAALPRFRAQVGMLRQ
ncbi:MAG: phosphate/phosphite/phosphonate ABC transporter substrate-binding protein [Gammaproteobacteria bacterium]